MINSAFLAGPSGLLRNRRCLAFCLPALAPGLYVYRSPLVRIHRQYIPRSLPYLVIY